MKAIYLFSAFVFLFLRVYSQIAGCMDPNAINFNSNAAINDGSCVYPVTNYTPQFLSNLSDTLNENSALNYLDNHIWTLNDSGNRNEIYEVNSANGHILRTVLISNAVNHDWESMAQSNTHIYIGDFGNNEGIRTDLSILKISKNDLMSTTDNTVLAEYIYFSYPDQVSFIKSTRINNTNFDGEALLFENDSLHIFSKNWVDLQTKHYRLPANAGTYIATLVEQFNVNGLITDAGYSPETGNIVLLGYKDGGLGLYTNFVWLLFDYHNTHFFSGNKRRIGIGNVLQVGQTEGILINNNNTGWFTSERVDNVYITIPAMLHAYDFRPYFYYIPVSNNEMIADINLEGNVYPNPGINNVRIMLPESLSESNYTIHNLTGQKVLSGFISREKNDIDISSLPRGTYIVNLLELNNRAFKMVKE